MVDVTHSPVERVPVSRALAVGQTFFGLAVMGSGMLQIASGQFVRLVLRGDASLAGHRPSAYIAGAVLMFAGVAIVFDRRAARVARGIAALLTVFLLFFVRQMAVNPAQFLHGFAWTAPLKATTLAGGAMMLGWSSQRAVRFGTASLAVFLVVCGMGHFAYTVLTASLIPVWIPHHTFWAYFAGVALIAGGCGMLLRPAARLAAAMSALMIFLWMPLVHIPRALNEAQHAAEASAVFEALAISGIALLVAGHLEPRARRLSD